MPQHNSKLEQRLTSIEERVQLIDNKLRSPLSGAQWTVKDLDEQIDSLKKSEAAMKELQE